MIPACRFWPPQKHNTRVSFRLAIHHQCVTSPEPIRMISVFTWSISPLHTVLSHTLQLSTVNEQRDSYQNKHCGSPACLPGNRSFPVLFAETPLRFLSHLLLFPSWPEHERGRHQLPHLDTAPASLLDSKLLGSTESQDIAVGIKVNTQCVLHKSFPQWVHLMWQFKHLNSELACGVGGCLGRLGGPRRGVRVLT